MTGPPDARHPFGPSRPDAWVLSGLVGLWAGGLTVWALVWGATGLPGAWWLSAIAGAVCLFWSLWSLRSRVQGELVWTAAVPGRDPGGWSLITRRSARGIPVRRIESALDLQLALLLRVHPRSGPPCWIWLLQRDDPQGWPAMRRAVFASGSR